MPSTLDYSTRKPRGAGRTAWIVILVIVLAALSLYYAFSGYYQVDRHYLCTTCGARYGDTRWFGLWSTHSEKPTSLSIVLGKHVPVAHAHAGVFVDEHGKGLLGVYYADSLTRLQESCTDPCAAALLDNLYTHGHRPQADLWRTRLLDPATARQACRAIDNAADHPFDLLPAAEFESWWSAHSAEIESAFTPTTTTHP